MTDALEAKKLLIRAVECDQSGRILEAQSLYQDGIAKLMSFVSSEPDDQRRKGFLTRIKEYMDRADAIKARVNGKLMLGEVVAHISIEENDTGYDYVQLFGKYMTDKTVEILIEEPYLTQNYQYQNLIRFLELAVTNCSEFKYLRLITKQDTANVDQQRTNLGQIKADLERRNVAFNIKYEDSLHDRKIYLSNGYIIKIGRGLHFYKANNPLYSIGLTNYRYRKCLQTDVDIWRNSSTGN
ncbi:MIT domain-containing protein 1 isoform X1 [Drosophila albomicans]|uniref:MIT domain-containing protein 1 isoform X1 n=1 Tax=Drosophila albomicans TaxID=7291 RepID=A0A6P8X5D4_DROAB|nr:MIT domain-containing protein 1 isoform X1 [Drosophila albomicans]